MGELWRKIAFLLRRRRFHAELDEEMRFHLEMKEQNGSDAYAARRQFGNVTLLKEVSREMWGWNSLEKLIQDVRYALRMIRRSPGLSGVAVLSLALGIGANTAIFSLIDTVMLRRLPVKDPQQLAILVKHATTGVGHSFSYPAVLLFRDGSRVLNGVAAFSGPQRVRFWEAGDATAMEQVSRSFVSGNFFEVLGTGPILGRTFTAAEDQAPETDPYAVISYSFWKRRFALDPSILGRRLMVDEVPVSVIGVAPPAFTGVEPGYQPDLWLPAMMMDKRCVTSPYCQTFGVIARVKPSVAREQAQAELEVLHRQHLNQRAAAMKDDRARKMFLSQTIGLENGSTGYSSVGARFSKPLLVMMAVVGAVLLIACANVANLLLARSSARRKEVAIRLAVGAGRVRLIRQLLTESAVLASIGGAAGLAVAYWGSRVLVSFVAQPGGIVVVDSKPDLRVLAFTGLVSLLSGLLFGIAPAFRSTRDDLAPALKEHARSVANTPGRFSIGTALVAGQVALSLALLIGGGLFVRSLQNLKGLDTGFSRKNILMFALSMPHGYKPPQVLRANQRVLEELQKLPGVASAGTAWPMPLSGAQWDDIASIEGYVSHPNEDMDINLLNVSRAFFETVQTPLMAGRSFAPADTASSGRVALINETMSRRFFGGASPVGKHLNCGSCGGSVEIIGAVRDQRLLNLREAVPPTVYFLNEQGSRPWGAFVARTGSDSVALASSLRQLLKSIDGNVSLDRPRTLTEQVDEVLLQERMIAKLSGFFGLLALLLASIGLYGVMSYVVVRRTNEIGIRMALGARSVDVLREILRETFGVVAIGIVAGVAAAISLTRLVRTMLFGLSAADPYTIVATTLLLAAVTLIAGYLPARRAAQVDPMVALRYE